MLNQIICQCALSKSHQFKNLCTIFLMLIFFLNQKFSILVLEIPYPRKKNAGVLLKYMIFLPCTLASLGINYPINIAILDNFLQKRTTVCHKKVYPGVLIKSGVLFARIRYALWSPSDHIHLFTTFTIQPPQSHGTNSFVLVELPMYFCLEKW